MSQKLGALLLFSSRPREWEKIYTFSFFLPIDILFLSCAAILMFYPKVSSLPWTRLVIA